MKLANGPGPAVLTLDFAHFVSHVGEGVRPLSSRLLAGL